MTPGDLLAIAVGAVTGFAVAGAVARVRMSDPPQVLMRTNVRGDRVPAVLGEPLAAGALGGLAALALARAVGWEAAAAGRDAVAVAVVVGVMTAVGALDDRGGDEAPRGFEGHLRALRAGRVTGGILKIVGGGVAGLAAGAVAFRGDAEAVVATALLVALGANAVNLFDRAPGRAGKVFLAAALPLMALGHDAWAVAAAGLVGALVACLPSDLAERAMLGDAGANPLGAVLGLGLALSLEGAALWVAVGLLVAVNGASERWSFSRAIAQTPWLERLDRIGRK